MKECPNCGKLYRDFDQYCLVCRYKLKYIEGTEKVEYCPEPTGSKYIDTQPSRPTVTCPYCHSTRCSRISILGRIVSVELWGLASNKLGKQWHCEDCGSNF